SRARDGREPEDRKERCVPEPFIRGDFASIEAGLLGMETPEAVIGPSSNIVLDHSGDGDDHARVTYRGLDEAADDTMADEEVRSWRPLYIMAAMIVAGVAGIFASFAFKGAVSSPDEVATIKAAEGPVKVQPDTTAASEPAGQDATVLGGMPQQAPVAATTNIEQPADLSAPVEVSGGQGAPRESLAGGGDAAGVPVPPPPAQAQSELPAGPQSIADLIEPKKVRTVSVRPDGTLLPNDAPPQSAPPPAASADRSTAAPGPKIAKTATRIAAAPKPAANADGSSQAAQTTVAPKSRPAAAQRGTFAIQLAAPASEQEARDLQARLMQKFGSELAGFQPSIRKAEVGGKEVYRVRFVGAASRDQAAALCQKVQSSGGNCFVAKN
ncbi:MAG: SPOR domain-containing protein, partial [Methylocapsa sp.]|nr:SPOR domain-containing protein [Methylocapsa sp.]